MNDCRKFLCDYVKEEGIKQHCIATMTGLSDNTVSRKLLGKRKISADEFFMICRAIKVPQERIKGFIETFYEDEEVN